MIITPMKSRMVNRIIFILFLLLTTSFLILPSSGYADYPTLLKNGFIDEVDSGGGPWKANQEDKGKEKKNPYDGTGFRISASVGFSDLTYFDYKDSKKPGLTTRVSLDNWFGDHFGLGFEFGLYYQFGSGYNYDDWYLIPNEYGYFLSPYVKFGLLSGNNWKVFFDLGLGFSKSQFAGGDGNYEYGERIFVKFALGWSIKISKHFETGIIIDCKPILALPEGSEDEGTQGNSLFLFSLYPFIGYVF